MANTAARQTKPASRLRRRLAASVILLGPWTYAAVASHSADAASTLMIDSRGSTYVIGSKHSGTVGAPLPPRRPGRARVAPSNQPVTLDLSVLDGLDQTRPENRQGPLRLNRPNRLLAEADRARAGNRIVLIPPRRASAAAPMIKLKPPKSGRRHGSQLASRGASNKFALAPLPPRRTGDATIDASDRVIAMAPAPTPVQVSPPVRGSAPQPPRAQALRQTPPLVANRNTLADLSPPPRQSARSARPANVSTTLNQTADLSPISPPGMTLPPPQVAAAPVLMAPPVGHPSQSSSEQARQPGLRPSAAPDAGVGAERTTASLSTPTVRADATLDQRARFPVIYERQDPPDMAKAGWQTGAPAAADRAARGNSDLPKLASLAPVGNAAARPGDAIAAPAPPPIRDLPEDRAEEIAALVDRRRTPPPEQPAPEPRKALNVSATLARVTPPGSDEADKPLTVLVPPAAEDESAAAPDFAPLPLPEAGLDDLVAIQPATEVQDAPDPRQLSLALDTSARAPGLRAVAPDRALETEIAFASESRALPATAEPELSRLAERLKADPTLKVQLSAAAQSTGPRRSRDLAIARALAVQRYLVRQGVLSEAIVVEPVTSAPGKDAVAVWLVEPA